MMKWLLNLTRPTRWLAVVIFGAGAVTMIMDLTSVWADAWLHHRSEVWISAVAVLFALSANALGALLWYRAVDYAEFLKIRDKALKLGDEVDAILKPLKAAGGGQIVGVVVRGPTGHKHVEYDDEPRVIN